MSKKANPTLIGVFTLAGLFIAALAIVLFGAGKFFERSNKILLFFDKSAMGLQVGSDVRIGGVRIGKVSSIKVLIDTDLNRKIIPVVVDLGERELKMVRRPDGSSIDFSTKKGVDKAVREGLRAGMKQQSLLTGQLYVEFDIKPDEPGFVYDAMREPPYPVVPTMGTQMDELIAGVSDGLKKFNSLDVDGVVKDLRALLASAQQQVAALDVPQINDNLVQITSDVKEITNNKHLNESIEHLNVVMVQLEELSTKANGRFDPVMKDLEALLQKTDASVAQLQEATKELSGTTNPRSPAILRMNTMLSDAERATKSIQELANDLKRNPNTILSGKENEP